LEINDMQTLSMKVGDLMLLADTIRNEGKNQSQESGNDKSVTASIKNTIKGISRFISNTRLKFRLKEVGSAIKCEGKLTFMGTKNIKIGSRSSLGEDIRIHTEGRGYIHIGANVRIGKGVKFYSEYNITIEDNTFIGEYVTIRDTITSGKKNETSYGDVKAVYIGKDAWIGKGTRIHAGVTIGHGSTVAANSVVTRSIPPGVIASGTPAKIVVDR
jgi:acetyltransferase-like isoleucine patch superfamily enzyme